MNEEKTISTRLFHWKCPKCGMKKLSRVGKPPMMKSLQEKFGTGDKPETCLRCRIPMNLEKEIQL